MPNPTNSVRSIVPRRSIAWLDQQLEAFCIVEDVEKNLVVAKLNQQKYVEVRRAFARFARGHGFSYPTIGRVLGKHHTTVIHLVKFDRGENVRNR